MLKQALKKAETWRHVLDSEDVSGTRYDVGHAVKRIKLPRKKDDIPQIFGWAGPARSGTTGLLFLFASSKKVNKAAFQPLKTILRDGGPAFELSRGDSLVCFKEVYRGCCERDNHDPIGMLLQAGVPPEKITWITLLRNPIDCFVSRTDLDIEPFFKPEHMQSAQRFAISLHHKYLDLGVNIVPLAYDLLELGEERVLAALLKKANLEQLLPLKLDFDNKEIGKKLLYGQAQNQEYFDVHLKDTLDRGSFIYKKKVSRLDAETTEEVIRLCDDDYRQFYRLSKAELGL